MSPARPDAQRTRLEGGERVDVLVVGARVSDIGAARYAAVERVAILEGRERAGGTSELLRYPDIRSE